MNGRGSSCDEKRREKDIFLKGYSIIHLSITILYDILAIDINFNLNEVYKQLY